MIDQPDRDRKVLPRWTSPAKIARTYEAQGLPTGVSQPQPTFSGLSELEEAWLSRPNHVIASDLVSAAIGGGDTDVAKEAAEYLLREPNVSSLARRAAARLLDPASQDELPMDGVDDESEPTRALERLRRLRDAAREDPGNALTWAERARHYVLVGENEKATQMMTVALGLAPDDRVILRGAVRLWVHSGDAERAHRLLVSSPRTARDPWLMSAEIAVAELSGAAPRFFKRGKQVLDGLVAQHATELASSIATLELGAGAIRKAKKFFQVSLIKPNENVIAQAEWASPQVHLPILRSRLLEVPGTHEAKALEAAAQGKDEDAVTHAMRWLREEPFSIDAAAFGSYHASKSQNYVAGTEFAERGLRTHRRNPVLLNNLAFCLAKADRVIEADEALGQIDESMLDQRGRAVTMATAGLVAFRKGDFTRGQDLYLDAARLSPDVRTRAIALIMLLTEYVRLAPEQAADIRELATESVANVHDSDVGTWLAHLRARSDQRTAIPPIPPPRADIATDGVRKQLRLILGGDSGPRWST